MPTHSLPRVTVRSLNSTLCAMGHTTKLQQEGDRTGFASLWCQLTEKKVPSVLSGTTNWSLVCRHCAELIQPDIRQLNGALEDRVIAPDPPTMEMKMKIVLRPCFGTQRVFLFSVDHGQHTPLLTCLKHVTPFCSADAYPMPTLQPRQLFFFFMGIKHVVSPPRKAQQKCMSAETWQRTSTTLPIRWLCKCSRVEKGPSVSAPSQSEDPGPITHRLSCFVLFWILTVRQRSSTSLPFLKAIIVQSWKHPSVSLWVNGGG